VEPGAQLLIVPLELLRLPISVIDRLQQLIVGLLARQESRDEFLNVRNARGRLDLLEGLVNLLRLLHLIVHLLPHEGAPQLLDLQLVAHLGLALVLALVRCGLRDLLIFLLSLDSPADRLLFVPDASLDLRENDLRVVVLLFDILHQFVDDLLRLDLLLAHSPALLIFELQDLLFVLERSVVRRGFDLGGEEVLLQPRDHVAVLISDEHLFLLPEIGVVYLGLQGVQFVLQVGGGALRSLELHLRLLNLLPHLLQLLLLVVSQLLDVIVFILEASMKKYLDIKLWKLKFL